MWLKCCPHCKRGDLTLERDQSGRYWSCIQCGWLKDAAGIPKAAAQIQAAGQAESLPSSRSPGR